MNLFENIVKKIKLHEELNINDYGIFCENIGSNTVAYTPYDNLYTTILVHYSLKDISQISFGGMELRLHIHYIENLLGKYVTHYNWRDDFTRFTFNEIQTKYVELIYLDKENKIEYDKLNDQFISKDVYGKQTIIPYNELIFNSFTIKYKSV